MGDENGVGAVVKVTSWWGTPHTYAYVTGLGFPKWVRTSDGDFEYPGSPLDRQYKALYNARGVEC